MRKHQFKVFLGVGLCASALVLTACGKGSDDPNATGAATVGDGDPGDGDGDDGDSDTGDDMTKPGDGDPGDGDGDGMSFVPTNDIPGANTCDPWAQDCPEDEKCAAYNAGSDTWNANKCVPLTGTAETGDPCTYDGATLGTDDCNVGFMCYYTNEEAVGICVPLCTGSPDDPQCEEMFNCSISNDGSLLLCLYSCDPILQDCTQGGAACFWDGAQFNCDPAGDIPTNEACGYINDCLPGHLCLDAEALPSCAGAACCASWCELSNPVCPIADTECIAFYEEGGAPPGLEDVGICALPGA